jgi:hypothetical protein
MRVLLVDRGLNADSRASLALLEQHLLGRRDVQCDRVDFDATDARRNDQADADCLVMLGVGLHIASDWSNLDVNPIGHSGPGTIDEQRIEVEPAAAARGHPVLDDVRPFVARGSVSESVGVPAGATCLLVGRTTDTVQPAACRPVAWAWYGHRGRVFCTSLGCAEDFRQPCFTRLLLNAINWIGRTGQG